MSLEEKQRPHAMIEVVAGAAEAVQLLAGPCRASRPAVRQKPSSDRLRAAASGLVMISRSSKPWRPTLRFSDRETPTSANCKAAASSRDGLAGRNQRVAGPDGQQLQEPGQHLLALAAAAGPGPTGPAACRTSRPSCNASPAPPGPGSVPAGPALPAPARACIGGPPPARVHLPGQDVHHGGREHVHAEQAEIVSRPASPAPAAAVRPRWGWAFPARVDHVQIRAAGHAPPAHRAVIRQHALARGLHGGHRTLLAAGPSPTNWQGAPPRLAADIQVIAHQVHEGLVAHEVRARDTGPRRSPAAAAAPRT